MKPIKGRPPKDKYNLDYMVGKINEYVEANKNKYPILKECCLQNDWNYAYVRQLQMKHEILSNTIKKLLDYKEIQLEKGAISGALNTTMAIFTLKQPTH